MDKSLLKTLGPGILFASTCIGVSHLVQSTRAGADYGFALVWAVLLANLFKYPFFEYASRYANATGTSIIDGYKRLGKPVLWLYALITLSTMFFVMSAVGVVTSGFMDNLFGISASLKAKGVGSAALVTPSIIFFVCIGILVAGKYKLLDRLIKVIGAVLLISTLLAFCLALIKGGQEPVEGFTPPDWMDFKFEDGKHLLFIIALMGWMPTALDLSSWNSLWTIARIKETGYKPKLKETLFDFNFGYLASALLAICFLTLGANLMYGTGEETSSSAVVFSNQVVNMYTGAMGEWSYWIIAPAAFSIMFGTCIAVFDGYARASERIILLLGNKEQNEPKSRMLYILPLLVLGGVSFGLMYYHVYNPGTASKEGFKGLVDIATTASFVVAPIIAVINFVLVGKKYVGEAAAPKPWLKWLSYAGIIFLTGFSILFLLK